MTLLTKTAGRHPLPATTCRKFAVGITLDQQALDDLVIIQDARKLPDRSATIRWLAQRERAEIERTKQETDP